MKQFTDLVFISHRNTPHFSTQASINFDNGYGVSVITGKGAYSSDAQPYEIAILHGDEIYYDSGITDDVIGYQTAEDVTNVMKLIQELPEKPTNNN